MTPTAAARKLTIRFTFPPAELSPNARIVWPAKHRIAKIYRDECGKDARNQAWDASAGRAQRLDGPVKATVTFFVRDRKRRDLDNLMARIKPLWDGLVDAGVLADDSAAHLKHGEPELVVDRSSPARVLVTLEEQR